ncbi:hypothetical protein HYR99_02075 [Candidatus Poribacteria bacterium]|nr:hypothetical protein [Candidatus Poribacteria bacterium]
MADSTFKQMCKELSTIRTSTVLSLVIPNEPLSPVHLLKVQECVKGKSIESLDVVVHSGGGDINTAYQIVELLRNHCKQMNVIVPIYAKSAATLLTLAADVIIMGEFAELGPLDSQIAEREGGVIRYNSALNPFKTLEQLRSFSLATLDLAAMLILSRTDLTVDEAIVHAIEFASSISQPLYLQLKPDKLGEYSRALAVGKEYGERLLRRYTKWQNDVERDAVLEQLVRGYPSHEYIIDYKELQDLGFDVRYSTEDEKPIIDSIIQFLIVEVSQTAIFCVCKPTTSKNALDKAEKKETTDEK